MIKMMNVKHFCVVRKSEDPLEQHVLEMTIVPDFPTKAEVEAYIEKLERDDPPTATGKDGLMVAWGHILQDTCACHPEIRETAGSRIIVHRMSA